jgi:fluoroacetyl-CoA thioesterase
VTAPDGPPIGLKHLQTITVDAGFTVPEVSPAFPAFRDMPPVLATAYLVGFVEATCIEALRPYLADQQRTVGIHVDLSHSAATPIGIRVTAEVELVAVEGRRLRFRVECRDEAEVVGAGFHERAIIDAPKFLARVQAKAGRRA